MIKKTIDGAELAAKYVKPSSKVITLKVSGVLCSSFGIDSTKPGRNDWWEDDEDED